MADTSLHTIDVVVTDKTKLCGFESFLELDREAWRVSTAYTYQVDRPPGDRRMWPTPDGKPPPLGPPPPLGTCRVHAIDPLDSRYEVRAGRTVVAEVRLEGPIIRVPGVTFDGIAVGSSASELRTAFPADRFAMTCDATRVDFSCTVTPLGSDQPMIAFYLGEKTRTVVGVQVFVDGPR